MSGGLTLRRLFVAFALLHLLFAVWPGIDLAVSRWFHDGAGFPLAESRMLHLVRHGIWNALVAVALASLAAWLVWLAIGRRALVEPRVWAYPAALAALGPGLLVNGILKEQWGRARPADIEAFGGEAAFSPPFEIVAECEGNCSFVSGEGSGAVATAIALGVLVRSTPLRIALGAVAALACGLRVATGRHFLSDVVFGAFLMAFAAILLFRLMRMGPALATLSWRRAAHDLRLLVAPLRRS
jgi:lipid A 4'-phosphatase